MGASTRLTRLGGPRPAPVVALGREMLRTAPRSAAVLLGVVAVTAALPAGLAVASGVLVAALTTGRAATSTTAPALALGVLFLLLQLLPPLAQALAESLGRRVDRAVRLRVMGALDRSAGVAHLEETAVADLVGGVNGGLVGTGMRDAVVGFANMGIARGGPLLGAVVLVAFHWWLAPLLLAAYSYAMVIVSRTYQRALESAEGSPALMRRATYLKDLVCTPAAAKEVRTFGLTDWLLGRYTAEFRSAISRTRGARAGVGRVSLGSGAIVLAGEALTFVLLGTDVMRGVLPIGLFTMFAVASTGLVGIATVTPDLLNIAVGGRMLADVAELERRTAVSDEPDAAEPPAPALRGTLVFEDVGFRYPGSANWVLRHLDLTIRAGTSLSVVGVNGAGKTTLVKLLCGLYLPTEGRILLDGIDLRTYDQRSWQRRFAALFQDWVRWGLPLRDNVILGAVDREPDPVALAAVADAAGLADVVAELPDGWDTVLSRDFGGVDLSGGQWQRVGLARALWALAGDVDVLVLDEPTSALDVRGELELFDRVLTAATRRTVVLISHRFSTVRHSDQIVVLEEGRVREEGDHATLMALGGRYAEMFAVQADRFADQGSIR